MRNINRLTSHITKYGSENILIHTIPGTSNWLICQKIEPNKWLITLGNPMGNITYNLGTITDEQHIELWEELLRIKIETKLSQIEIVKNLRQTINNFIKRYKKFIKKSK